MNFPAEIKKAASLGDLSENAEYHMAKQRQVFVNARLGQLKTRMGELALVNLSNIPKHDRIAFGSTVTVYDTTKDEKIEYKLVTSEESDVNKGSDFDHLSHRSRTGRQAGRRRRHRRDSQWQARTRNSKTRRPFMMRAE